MNATEKLTELVNKHKKDWWHDFSSPKIRDFFEQDLKAMMQEYADYVLQGRLDEKAVLPDLKKENADLRKELEILQKEAHQLSIENSLLNIENDSFEKENEILRLEKEIADRKLQCYYWYNNSIDVPLSYHRTTAELETKLKELKGEK